MQIKELLKKNRSYRRFDERISVSPELLKKWISHARLTPSAANLQPLRYVGICHPETNAALFPAIRWAAYLKDWQGPSNGEKPSAYIVMLCQGEKGAYTAIDAGIALQSILLSAVEDGFGGCAIASMDIQLVKRIINPPPNMEVLLTIALGKPVEQVVLEDTQGDDIRYWRDPAGIHHVPKRPLDEILLKIIS